jgi:hypothetical protein
MLVLVGDWLDKYSVLTVSFMESTEKEPEGLSTLPNYLKCSIYGHSAMDRDLFRAHGALDWIGARSISMPDLRGSARSERPLPSCSRGRDILLFGPSKVVTLTSLSRPTHRPSNLSCVR